MSRIKIQKEVTHEIISNQACKKIEEIQLASKFHRCSLFWCDKCAYCEFGFDELMQKIDSTNEPSEELRNNSKKKIEECKIALEEKKKEFQTNFKSKSEFVHDEIEIRCDSLNEDLDINRNHIIEKVDHIEEKMSELIKDELKLIKEKQLNELSKINREQLKDLIQNNANTIQQYLDFKLKILFTNGYPRNEDEFKLNFIAYSNKKLNMDMNLLCKKFDTDKCEILMENRDYYEISDFICLNKRFYAILHHKKFDAIDKRTNKIYLSEECDYIKGLDDGKVIKVLKKKITLMDENLNIIKESSLDAFFPQIEVINEKLIIAAKKKFDVSDFNGMHPSNIRDKTNFIDYFKFCAIKNNYSFCFRYKTFECIKGIKTLSENKFAYFTDNKITVLNLNGQICQGFGRDRGDYESVNKLSDVLLVALKKYQNHIQIWNYELGVLVKEILNTSFVGLVPFGFLVRPKDDEYPLVLHAYDNELNDLGTILTESISKKEKIKKVAYIGNNLYAIQFDANHQRFKIIKSENFDESKKRNVSHLCALKWSKRCAFCEIGYIADENLDLTPILIKSHELFEEVKNECSSVSKSEFTRFRQELINKIEKEKDKLRENANANKRELDKYVKEFVKSYEIMKFATNLNRLDKYLKMIQRFYFMNFNIEFDYESFKLSQYEVCKFQFTLKQKMWDLITKYFVTLKKNSLLTINAGRNRIIEKFIQVADNKIAALFRTRFGIYSMVDGALLMSMPIVKSFNYKVFSIENRYAIVYYKIESRTQIKKRKLIIINLNDFNCYGTYIENEITSMAYLKENGYLILGGPEISVWNTNCWPFKKIKNMNLCLNGLLTLTVKTFASTHNQEIRFWDYNVNLLKKLKTDDLIWGLKQLDKERFLVLCKIFHNKTTEILISSCISGEILEKIKFMDDVCYNFLTPDKNFLVLAGKEKILFYNINDSFFNVEQQMTEKLRSVLGNSIILEDFKFGHFINSNRAIEIFSYNE